MTGVKKFSFASERARLRIERILFLLKHEPMSVQDLAERLHGDKTGINPYIIHLRTNPKRIYVSGWRPGEIKSSALYSVGNRPDMPYPKKTKADYWQEVKADPVRHAKHKEAGARKRIKERGREHLIREVTKYDPPLIEQVRVFVEAAPGNTGRQIAQRLDANYKAVKQCLSDLKRRGLAHYKVRTKDGGHWESTKRQTIRHAPVVNAQQGIFSALGI